MLIQPPWMSVSTSVFIVKKSLQDWLKGEKPQLAGFFGFKLHWGINDRGEWLNVFLPPANVDDRKPVPALVRKLFGKIFGDKGYISQTLPDFAWIFL